MKRLICLSLALAFLCITLEGCAVMSNPDPPSTIGEISFDSGYKGEHLVYIQENSEYVPYIVVTNDYQGNCLLVRKSVISTVKRMNDYDAYYENCEIDKYLNNDFLLTLGTLTDEIIQSNIIITDKSSLGCSGNTTKEISRKIFLLSLTELCFDDSVNTGIEGRPLTYFENPDNRIAYKDNGATSWWLRTPNSYYFSCIYGVGSDGGIGYGNAFDENGIRPAFCVPSSMRIVHSSVFTEENAYTLENN